HVGEAVQAVEQQVCVKVQRGTGPGAVADADVKSVAAKQNFGDNPRAIVGWPGRAGSQKLLLRFDLGFLPPGTNIVSATATLTPTPAFVLPGTVQVHPVIAPWDESTVTWNSSLTIFDNTVLTASFANGDGSGLPAPISFDLTSIARGWI